jgi:diadenosine tetraphosphate (Ap4A) HIT family hydrolase
VAHLLAFVGNETCDCACADFDEGLQRMSGFELHPRLAADCICLGQFELSRLLLMDDANYPWFILVPARSGVREIMQLDSQDQLQLMRECVRLSELLQQAFKGDKLNIAALGNVVAQLHVHIIVRYRTDPAWPEPVWGRVARRPHEDEERASLLGRLRPGLDKTGFLWMD